MAGVPSLLVQGAACGGMQQGQGQQALLGRPGLGSPFSGLQLRRGRAVLEFADLGCRDGWRVYAARGGEPGIPRWNRRSARSGQSGGVEGRDVILVADKSSGQTSTSGKVTESVAAPAVEPKFADQGGYIGSPLLWIGVGVGLSALLSWASGRFKKYAMQQVLKSMAGPKGMGGMPGIPGFSGIPGMPGVSALGPVPFPFPPIPTPSPVVSASSQTVDVQTFIKPLDPVQPETTVGAGSTSTRVSSKPSAFTDVPASTIEEEKVKAASAPESAPSAAANAVEEEQQPRTAFFQDTDVVDNGAGWENNTARSSQTSDGKPGSVFTVQALERMMEDPMVQKMVYPYLPEEMRNPSTFKWMLQNPQYRQQLQDMLNNLGGDGTWDNRMSDMLKNFDLNSTEVKQQFEQIGLTPEEVVAKIMANPDVALAFQNPRVQAAIMDCSQNPLNITKYQNDKEVMDVFNKISELFPGMTGAPYEV